MTAIPPTVPPGPGGATGPIPAPARPSTSGYWIGSAVIVLAVVIGVSLFVSGLRGVVDLVKFPQQVQSDGSVEIAKPGNYIVYQIGQEDSAGTTGGFNQPRRIAASDVSVLDPSGATVKVGDYETSRTSSSNFRTASAIATFHAYQSGSYHVSSGALSPGESLGVGSGKKFRAGTIGLGLIVGLGGTLTGIIVVIVTAVRRSRSKPVPAWGTPVPPGYGQPQMPYGQPPVPGWNAPPVPPGWNAPPPGPQRGWNPPPPAATPSPPGPPGPPSAASATWPPVAVPPPPVSNPGVDDPGQSGWGAPR